MCCISRSARQDLSCCGASSKSAIASRSANMFDYLVSGVVAALLFIYLGWAMFKPEKF